MTYLTSAQQKELHKDLKALKMAMLINWYRNPLTISHIPDIYCPQCHGPCLRRPRHNDGLEI